MFASLRSTRRSCKARQDAQGKSPPCDGGKLSQTVSLELAPEQVKQITVARQLGTLSLAVRAAVDQWIWRNPGAMSSCDVSPELARQNAVAGQTTSVVVHTGGEVKQYSVRKEGCDSRAATAMSSTVGARPTAAAGLTGRLPEKR